MPRKPTQPLRKLFVLDTNILLHDPSSSLKFEEHDIYIPFVTLEELDGKKVGTQDVNRNARQATRILDEIVSQAISKMEDGFPLTDISEGKATGRLYLQQKSLPFLAEEHIRKNDNLYLAVLDYLKKENSKREIIMVTKDLNLRIKARAMGFLSSDYLHDHAITDTEHIYRGIQEFNSDFFEVWADEGSLRCWTSEDKTYYEGVHFACVPNEFLLIEGDSLYQVIEVDTDKNKVKICRIPSLNSKKASVIGITPRNEEQQAAVALLLDPDIDFVALLGPAGTGKTLLAIAAGLQQSIKSNIYDEIIFTRATIPLGEDIGFLPGTEEEKMRPWVGALDDNLEVLAANFNESKSQEDSLETLKSKVSVKAITFMRGRTFQNKYLIIDEAQNLTPKQIRTLITRAGEGTKIICMGNLAQIDSPYLSEASSGLTYAVERFKGWPHFGALVLSKGERSRLASAGNDRL